MDKGEKLEDYCLLERYLCQKITFICSRISFPMVYSFYFLCVGSRRNEYNGFWEELRGERSGGCGLFRCYFHYAEPFSSFTDDKMILQAITVHDDFIIILSQYIVFLDVCHALYDTHLLVR